ncbi:MAG: beta-ketoacyl synthase N-terminal-like domain-containing protein, partial [Candidatus Omnitrophota bacterium]
MLRKRRVVVTGLGAVSPIGHTIDKFWNSLLEGKSGVKRLTRFDPSYYTCKIGAEITDFDPSPYLSPKELRRMDRFVQFAVVGAKKAVVDSKIDLEKVDRDRFGVLVGSGIGGLHTVEAEHRQYLALGPEKGPDRISPFLIPMLIINMASGQISITLGLKGPNSAVGTACATGN